MVNFIKLKYYIYFLQIKLSSPDSNIIINYNQKLFSLGKINKTNLDQACSLLGDISRANYIRNDKSSLYESINKDKDMTSIEFVEAWLFENQCSFVTQFIKNIDNSIILINKNKPLLTFEIRKEIKLGLLFRKIEKKKTELSIANYSIYQSSLEQIFNLFANENVDEQ